MPSALASRGERISTGSTVDLDRAGVACDRAAEDLHQRRFSGAVLADQRHDLTCADCQANVIERNNPWESFADSLHFEDWGVCCHRLV